MTSWRLSALNFVLAVDELSGDAYKVMHVGIDIAQLDVHVLHAFIQGLPLVGSARMYFPSNAGRRS